MTTKTHILLKKQLFFFFTLLVLQTQAQTEITSLSSISSSGNYIITQDIDASNLTTTISSFSGTLEAAINPATKMPYRITNLSVPLFTTLTGTVKNLVIDNVNITSGDASGNTGAIACTANGSARIYNVGILGGSVGGSNDVGGIVGFLDGTARVVNRYSYADITSGDSVGGIVGYNKVATASNNLKTMVFGCMFYGDFRQRHQTRRRNHCYIHIIKNTYLCKFLYYISDIIHTPQ